jgi:hypothetical protein
MPPKRTSSTRSTRANSTGKNISSIKPLSTFALQKGRKAAKRQVVDNTVHVVTPSKRSPIEVETVQDDEKDDEFIQPIQPANKVTRLSKKKVAGRPKKKVIAVVVPKKVGLKGKKIIAVMNVESGAATIFKTPKQARDFLTQMVSLGGANHLKMFIFEDEEHYAKISNTYKKRAEPPTPISTPTTGIPLSVSASTPVSPNKQANPLSAAVSKQYARLNKPAIASNKLASQLQQKLSGLNGTSLKLLLFPEAVCVTDNEKYQVFAIDLVENKSDSTVWTHKPDAWSKLFQMDEELTEEEGGHTIEPFFYSLQATCPRSEAKGPNVRKQLHTKNDKTVDCQLLWGMIKCTTDTEATLKVELVKFSTLASNQGIQQAYFVAVQQMGTTYPALLDQVRPLESSKPKHGEYWTKLTKSCASPIKIVHHTSMDEVFQDDVISTTVAFLWEAGGQSTSMWNAEMNMFAYGRST